MDVAEAVDRSMHLLGLGRPDEALECLLAAAKEHRDETLDHQIAGFYMDRGWARLRDRALAGAMNGDFFLQAPDWEFSDDLALSDFEEALKWGPQPEALAGKAAVLLARGDLDAAGAAAAEATEADPEYPVSGVLRARLHCLRNEWDAAIALLKETIPRAPDYGAGYVTLAEALAGADRHDDALNVLLEAEKFCTADVAVLLALATRLGKTDAKRALEKWRRATEINHASAPAWRGLAGAAADLGDELLMTRALDRAVELDAGGTQAWLLASRPDRPALKSYPDPPLEP